MFNNSKRKKYSADLISLVLNLPFKEVVNSMIFVNNKLNLESIKNPRRCVDFLCKINDEYIGIEMNNNIDNPTIERKILAKKAEAVHIGKKEGIGSNIIKTAKKMLQENLAINIISKCTGLSESERDKVIKKSLLGKYFVSR